MTVAKLVSNSAELKGARKTVSVYMTAHEHRAMVKLAKNVGLSYSAIVRRLVTAYADGSISPRSLPKVEKSKAAVKAAVPA